MITRLIEPADLRSNGVPRILDIGGEGRHAQAWNLNPSPVRTLGSQRGSAIPRLILGRAEQIPLPDKSVNLIISERTPLRAEAYLEIKRVLSSDGFIVLRHAVPPGFDPHREAYRHLPRRLHQRTIALARCSLQETLFYNGRCNGVIRRERSRWHGG